MVVAVATPGSTGGRRDAVVAALASAASALGAVIVGGRTHPDEVFQFLEPANFVAFGFGHLSWEWHRGIRNWAVPDALAGGMRLVHALGWTTPWGHRVGAALVVAVLAFPGLLALLRYARRRLSLPGEPEWHAVAALVLIVTWSPCLYFLGRTMGEPMGALLAFAGLEALDRDATRDRDALLAGFWLGLSVVVRYAFAAFVVLVVLDELQRRRWRVLALMLASGGVVALLLGELDAVTWGEPFHSMVAYLAVNLGHEAGDRFGREPWWYYFRVCGWLPWPFLFGLPWLDRRRARALPLALVYLLILCATAHKEFRFLFPVVLWMAADGAPAFVAGLWAVTKSGRPRSVLAFRGALTVFAVASAATCLSFPPLCAPLFRATVVAGEQPGLTGALIVDPTGRWGSGGDFYLGHDVPVSYGLPGETPFIRSMRDRSINVAVASGGIGRDELEDAGFHIVASTDSDGTCVLRR